MRTVGELFEEIHTAGNESGVKNKKQETTNTLEIDPKCGVTYDCAFLTTCTTEMHGALGKNSVQSYVPLLESAPPSFAMRLS